MAKPGPLSSAPQFTTHDIKRSTDLILAIFELNCAKRNSLARTLRIELTRKTTPVGTPEADRITLKKLIAENRDRIIGVLVNSTCLRDTETPQATASAIYTEIMDKFNLA